MRLLGAGHLYSGGGLWGNALGRPNAPDEVPAATTEGATAVELTIARIVVQAITKHGIASVGSSRTPDPVLVIAEGAIVVAAAGDCGKSSKTRSSSLPSICSVTN